ncbi:MAG: RloB family protein [Bacteroidales bacterium]|nr:RloB family protein [Bacteroidales bacterium]
MARKKDSNRDIRNPEVVIIGEGMTERFYFQHLKRLKGFRYMCKPRYFTQQTITDLDRQIGRVLSDGGVAVCVFDADVTRLHDSDRKQLKEMRTKYAQNPNVILCDSMPSIEFWFLLHFISTSRYFANSNEAEAQLRRYLTEYEKKEKFLQREKWVIDLISNGKFEDALKRAKQIGETGESYTNLYRAFDAFKM